MMAIGWRCDGDRHVQTLFALGPIGDLTDGQLLERFANRDGERAELAFAALVERHGPMVLRTCRAVLRDGHDAHDAFQATFLVLARRAGSLWAGESLASWLHQVARRTALCARSASARRRKHEGQAAALTAVAVNSIPQDDLGEVLHAEISRLPDRYRAAVVLCLLEGLTHDQAAHHLGWPVGTLQSRLARGRERLRSRLTRRGLAPTVASTGVVVPSALIDSTARAATGFAAGQIKTGMVSASVLSLIQEVRSVMFLSKLKLVGVAVLAVGLGASGVGVLAQQDDPKPAGVAEGKKIFPANPPIGERITILVERPDASGQHVVKQRVTSRLDEAGEWRITNEIMEGEHAGSSTLTCKVAKIEIQANALADPAAKSVEIEISALSPGPVSVSTTRASDVGRAKGAGMDVRSATKKEAREKAAREIAESQGKAKKAIAGTSGPGMLRGSGMMGSGMAGPGIFPDSDMMGSGKSMGMATGSKPTRANLDYERRLGEMERKLGLILNKLEGR